MYKFDSKLFKISAEDLKLSPAKNKEAYKFFTELRKSPFDLLTAYNLFAGDAIKVLEDIGTKLPSADSAEEVNKIIKNSYWYMYFLFGADIVEHKYSYDSITICRGVIGHGTDWFRYTPTESMVDSISKYLDDKSPIKSILITYMKQIDEYRRAALAYVDGLNIGNMRAAIDIWRKFLKTINDSTFIGFYMDYLETLKSVHGGNLYAESK